MTTTSATKGKKASTNEVAELPKNELATAPAIDFEADAGMGMEGVDKDSVAIPFLTVLQGLSPQLETVEGAKPGLIINTVTNQLYTTLDFVPVAFQRRYNRWAPNRGGFKGTMTVAEVETAMANGKAVEERFVHEGKERSRTMFEGTELKDTRNHFVLVLDGDGGWSPALMSLSSTQIKKSKQLMAMVQNFTKKTASGKLINPPSFARYYRASTVEDSNESGKWKAWAFTALADVADPALYQAAKEFHSQVTSGSVVVAPPPEDGEVDPSGKAF